MNAKGWTVESPESRRGTAKANLFTCDMRAWHRIVDADGSTVGFAPDIVTARQFAASPDLLEACRQIVWKVLETQGYQSMRADVVIKMAADAVAKAIPE